MKPRALASARKSPGDATVAEAAAAWRPESGRDVVASDNAGA
jgi:hypothetical protein